MQRHDMTRAADSRLEKEQQLRRDLRSVLRKVLGLDATVARRLGIHGTDLASLELLETADEPVTPTMLSDYLGISTGSATAAIDRLERAGFVRRVPNSHDRRGIIIEPVEGQQERLLSAYHQLRSRYAELIEGISDDELDVINRFLKGIERIELS